MLRVVIDTNIIISGAFWIGLPRDVLAAIRANKAQMLATVATIAELNRTLSRPKFQTYAAKTNQKLEQLIETYTAIVERVEPVAIPAGIVRDPKDEMILGCAVGGKADAIVTGDQDLLVLGIYEGVPIWTAAQFLHALKDDDKRD